MKKLLFIAIFVSLTLLNCATTPKAALGAKAGVNFSDITGKDVESFNGLTSFHVGVVTELGISDKFAVQPELLYSAQGSDYGDQDYSGSVKADYLNIPVMAKYYLAEGFSVEAGPQIGFLISAKDEFDGGDEDIKDFLKSTDFGVNLGLGYRLESGLNFGARYNLGLSNVNDSPDLDGGAEYKNGVIQVSVGYFFN